MYIFKRQHCSLARSPSVCWLCLLCSLSVCRITTDLLPFHADSSHLTARCTASCRMEIKSCLEQMHSAWVCVVARTHTHMHPMKSKLVSVLTWHPAGYLMAPVVPASRSRSQDINGNLDPLACFLHTSVCASHLVLSQLPDESSEVVHSHRLVTPFFCSRTCNNKLTRRSHRRHQL